MKTKQVIIFIIEGQSDKFYINAFMKQKKDIYEPMFIVIEGDITATLTTPAKKNKTKNIIEELSSLINKELNNSSFDWNDVYKIIHITDLDCCYMADEKIIKKDTARFEYGKDCIQADNPDEVKQRNGRKRKRIEKLLSWKENKYGLYFMSRNVEHVFLNKHIPNKMKMKEAFHISKNIEEANCNVSQYFAQKNESKVCFNGNYNDSWEYIKSKDGPRMTNINIILDELLN